MSPLLEDEGKDELYTGSASGTDMELPVEFGLDTSAVVMLRWLAEVSLEPMLGSLSEVVFLNPPVRFCWYWLG